MTGVDIFIVAGLSIGLARNLWEWRAAAVAPIGWNDAVRPFRHGPAWWKAIGTKRWEVFVWTPISSAFLLGCIGYVIATAESTL